MDDCIRAFGQFYGLAAVPLLAKQALLSPQPSCVRSKQTTLESMASSSPPRQKRSAERGKRSDVLQWSDEGALGRYAVPLLVPACIDNIGINGVAETSQAMPVALQIHAPLHDWTVGH